MSDLDPITYEVLRHRLWAIDEEAASSIARMSGSPIVRAGDFLTATFLPDGEVGVTTAFLTLPIGTMQLVIRAILDQYGDDIHEGDVFFNNDPFVAATHQNDIQIAVPMFVDGELFLWSCFCLHELDVGGMEPGSWCPKARDVHMEGFRIPPVKLYERGRKMEGLWRVILNATRMPALLEMDLQALLAAGTRTHERFTELCERYGPETVQAALGESLRQGEAAARARLRALPDAVIRHVDFIDHDGHTNEIYKVVCEMRKVGDQLTFDFTGSDPQTPGSINGTLPGLWGALATVLFEMIAYDLPWNGGVLRCAELIVPDGTLITAQPPAPVSSGSAGAVWPALTGAQACLAKLLALGGEDVAAEVGAGGDGGFTCINPSGVNQFGEYFADMFLEPSAPGGNAYAWRDGADSSGASIIIRGSINDTELVEHHEPFLHLWRRERPASGGAGRYRGGNSADFATTAYDTESFASTVMAHGFAMPNRLGLFGGYPGSNAFARQLLGAGLAERFARGELDTGFDGFGGREWTELEAKASQVVTTGDDLLSGVCQGGAGFGDPLLRDPAAVLEDVIDGAYDAAYARTVYGVAVVDEGPSTGRVDEQATASLRDELRAERLSGATAPRLKRDAPPADGDELLSRWGGVIDFVRRDETLQLRCSHCETSLGDGDENWKDYCAIGDFRDRRVPNVHIDQRLAAPQYFCPGCATCLGIELVREGDEPVRDVELGLEAFTSISRTDAAPALQAST
jgi:N-methylhydantoinase B